MTEEELQKRIEALETDLAKAEADKKAALGEKFKLAQDLKEAQEAKDEAVDAAKAETGTDLEKAIKRAEKAEKALETSNAQIADIKKQARISARDTAIADLITANKVNPDDAKAVKALILMELDQDSDQPSVGGQPLADFAKGYFAKEGKRYVQPANHNGGGATGSEGAKAPRMTADNWNWSEFGKIQLENPEEARALAQAAGKKID